MKGRLGTSGTHTAQLFVFDRQARLCYRTADAPAIAEIEALLAQVARLRGGYNRPTNRAASPNITTPIRPSSTCQARGRANTGASQRAP